MLYNTSTFASMKEIQMTKKNENVLNEDIWNDWFRKNLQQQEKEKEG